MVKVEEKVVVGRRSSNRTIHAATRVIIGSDRRGNRVQLISNNKESNVFAMSLLPMVYSSTGPLPWLEVKTPPDR